MVLMFVEWIISLLAQLEGLGRLRFVPAISLLASVLLMTFVRNVCYIEQCVVYGKVTNSRSVYRVLVYYVVI